MENPEWSWRQSKPTDRWYIELLVKRLSWINSLNDCATNCASFKNCGVVPSFYIKRMKLRILQACSSMQSIKNGMFLYWANWTYLIRSVGKGRGGRGESFLFFPLGCTPFYKCFPVSFNKYFRIFFLQNMSRWLLLLNVFWFVTSTTTTKCVVYMVLHTWY